MPEHYTKTTVGASFWGAKCSKNTMHDVFDGRRAGCHECRKKREEEKAVRDAIPPPATQESLF